MVRIKTYSKLLFIIPYLLIGSLFWSITFISEENKELEEEDTIEIEFVLRQAAENNETNHQLPERPRNKTNWPIPANVISLYQSKGFIPTKASIIGHPILNRQLKLNPSLVLDL